MVATIDVPESWQEWGLVDPDLSKVRKLPLDLCCGTQQFGS